MDPWEGLRQEVVRLLDEGLSGLRWRVSRSLEETLEEPPDPRFGDIATTVGFELSKTLRENPQSIAKELVGKIKPRGLIERIEPVGGYVNFFVEFSKFGELTLEAIERFGERYGHLDIGNDQKVVIEHTSVNPTKPLHIGHGRNAIIGDTMARVFRALGYRVEVQNYIDDLGRQVAETLVAYDEVKEKPKGKFDHVLGIIYAQLHERLEEDLELEQKVRGVLASLERGEKAISEVARRLCERCVKANLLTTDRLGISYDLLVWESDVVRSGILGEVLDRLRATPYLVEGTGDKSGTLVLRFPDGIEDKVLIRSNGTAVYTARDIAYQVWKFGCTKAGLRFRFHSKRKDGVKTYTTSPKGKAMRRFGRADKVINVVGSEQKFPQRVVFASLKLMGLEQQFRNSYHLAYEHVRLPDQRFSGRKGTWMGFSVDDVLEETISRARAVMEERAGTTDERFKRRVAESVGVGALRFSLLSTSPEKEIVFKWEEALDFDRNSGPAIQYSYARACSILRKIGKYKSKRVPPTFRLPEEKSVLKLLAKYPGILRAVGEKLQPNILARYVAELALEFNKFYEAAPVIEAETPEIRVSRLRLVKCTRIVLKNSMRLLGIPVLERM